MPSEICTAFLCAQLHDYLESLVCLRPSGYDPMINVLSVRDVVRAMEAAFHSEVEGVFNIPGKDSLPLSTAIVKWGRLGVPVPGNWLTTPGAAGSPVTTFDSG